MGEVLETHALTENQLEDARKLAETCNQIDSLDYLHVTKDFASHGHHFQFFEAQALVGFLTFPFEVDVDPEAYVVVDPHYRRKGIGRSLVSTASRSLHGVGVPEFLLVCEETSIPGEAFARALGAHYRHSEYRLRLERSPSELSAPPSVELRQADGSDLTLLAKLMADSFGNPIKTHIDRLKRDLGSPTYRFYIAHLTGKPMGCIGVVEEDRRAYVIAFGILAEFRNRGYGRQILTQTVNHLLLENWDEVLIEVSANNRAALGLYESCGFKQTRSYSYYARGTTN